MDSFKAKVGRLLTKAVNALGENAKYCHQAGGSVLIRAIFDLEAEQVDPNTEVIVSSNAPRLGVKLVDLLEAPREGDTVEVGTAIYRVVDSVEDGQGGATLWLHKQ